MKRPNLQKICFKKKTLELLKNTRNRKAIVVDYIKKNAKCFTVI